MSAPPSAPALLEGLNPSQRAAVEAVRGPVRILAGAGSGKTRTITHRIAHQIATGTARPDQILAVTFTDKAAGELRHRLARLGAGPRPGAAPVRAATFHSAAWAQLRYFWPRVSDAPLPEVVESKVRLLVPAARRHGVEARDLAAEIEWAKSRMLAPDDYAAAAGDRQGPLEPAALARVFAAYERANREAGRIDFDDMILETVRVLTANPEIAAEVRERYRFLTVDEFQDTNPAQWTLLRTWLGDGDELCVVGDDDQTIYRFAGASARYLVEFTRTFPQAVEVTLSENYRSTRQVVELANGVLWTKPAATRKRLVSRCGDGPPPVFTEFEDGEDEVNGVVAEIRRLRGTGVPAGEIAVGYRTNSQSEPYEQALRVAGIPYVVRGDGGFFDRPEIRQALGALRAAADRPARRDPAELDTAAAHPPLVDREVEAVLRESLSWHPRREPSGDAARERWRNVGVLVGLAADAAEADRDTTLADFTADLLARAAEGAETADPDGAVTLLSLHRAKGLEFTAVFLVALEEGLLPISHAKEDEEVEDERRLFYVGVTRARRHLWLSWAWNRTSARGRTARRRPSRFLYGLGDGAPQAGSKDGAARGAKAAGSSRTCACGRPLVAAGERKAGRCDACADAAVDPELAERLRTWRRERSSTDGVPAYVVFSDRTLRDLAGRRPATPTDLLAVHGFGKAKVERYGEELLRLVSGG